MGKTVRKRGKARLLNCEEFPPASPDEHQKSLKIVFEQAQQLCKDFWGIENLDSLVEDGTPVEKIFRLVLHTLLWGDVERQAIVVRNYPVVIDRSGTRKKYVPDFVLYQPETTASAIIEIDGYSYHERDPIQFSKERDREVRLQLVRKSNPRAYEPWTEQEEDMLVKIYSYVYEASELAPLFQRQASAIQKRLKKLDVIPPEIW